MLHLIPPPLHRQLLRIAHALRKRWWRWWPAEREGVCIIALCPAGELLLLRQSYATSNWVLPGGGKGEREGAEEAARREFEEEAGCAICDLAFALVSEERIHGSLHRVHIFTGLVDGTPRPDGREIVAARLFALDSLPRNIDGRVLRRLRMAGIL